MKSTRATNCQERGHLPSKNQNSSHAVPVQIQEQIQECAYFRAPVVRGENFCFQLLPSLTKKPLRLIPKPECDQTRLPRADGSGRPSTLLSQEALFHTAFLREQSHLQALGTLVRNGVPRVTTKHSFPKTCSHSPSGENWSLSNMVIHRTSWYRSLMKNWQLKFHLGFKVSCRVLVV